MIALQTASPSRTSVPTIADLLTAKYPPLVTLSEFAEIMNHHPQTVRLMLRKGKLPVPVISFADKRILLSDIIGYLEQQREAYLLNGAPKRRGPKIGSKRKKAGPLATPAYPDLALPVQDAGRYTTSLTA